MRVPLELLAPPVEGPQRAHAIRAGQQPLHLGSVGTPEHAATKPDQLGRDEERFGNQEPRLGRAFTGHRAG